MNTPEHNGMRRMLDGIRAEVGYTKNLIGKSELDERVMHAMASVPREQFVPAHMRAAAFDNGPLPIGHGQTISQPYMVALMSDLLQLQPEDSVLEIGSGSGYQTAVLSLLCSQVYSMELVPELAEQATARLARLGYDNVYLRSGNGYQGWPEHAPYDGVIVTAAAPYVPDALFDQLKPGGRLVIPIGLPYMHQELMLVSKDENGERHTHSILGVAFVPLVDTRAGGDE